MALDVEKLYEAYGPMVLRRCRGILGHEEDAVDAMQETFVRVLERADKLDARAPSSLLYTTATRVCLNRIRSAKRRPEQPNSEVIARIAQLPDAEERTLARRALDRLFGEHKASTRLIAALYYIDGMTYQEVADEVSMSVSGVRKRLRQLKASVER
ncbi:MAG: sigma-70 family RNA polymerase sigma factor [Myxococcota bacterium]